jgi:Xaa-Pro aminopeptidase
MDFADRRKRLLKALKSEQLPSLLITNPVNVSYLTGFTGDDSYLFLTPREAILLSDGRFAEQIESECPDLKAEIRVTPTSMLQLLESVVTATKAETIAFESAAMSFDFHHRLTDHFPQLDFVPTTGLVEKLREIKDKYEIEAIRKAVDCAQRAFNVVRAGMRPEQTEKEIADELEWQIRRFGGKCCAFPSIVGVGPRAALPHGTPTSKQVQEDDFVLIDWGARVGQYISDLTRVLVTGKISPKLERLYGVVLRAQKAAIEAIRPGVLMQEVDAAARDSITRDGCGKAFNHGLGHGIGLQVHESTRLGPNQQEPLQAGMVITIEPGIYFPGWGGIRLEDDVLVTRSGHEVLSSLPKELDQMVVGR